MNHSTKIAGGITALIALTACGGSESEPTPTVTETETVTETVTVTETPEPDVDIWLLEAEARHLDDLYDWAERLYEANCDIHSLECFAYYAEGSNRINDYGDWLSGFTDDELPDYVHFTHRVHVNLAAEGMEDLVSAESGTSAYANLVESEVGRTFEAIEETREW